MFALTLLHLTCLRQETAGQVDLVKQITESGRCVTLAETPDEKTKVSAQIAPGQPPMLTFRYYEGKMHHRYGNNELMLDDAGH